MLLPKLGRKTALRNLKLSAMHSLLVMIAAFGLGFVPVFAAVMYVAGAWTMAIVAHYIIAVDTDTPRLSAPTQST